jgi:hypothetical protein
LAENGRLAVSDSALQAAEGVVLTVLVTGCVLIALVRFLRRSRPEFAVGRPLAVGFAIRLVAIAAISLTGLQATLRGGDETTFLRLARNLAHQPIGRGYWPHGPYQLHTVLFALEDRLGFMTVGAMRVVQVGIALAGALLILAAVHDLAGGRAARLAAWLIAFEPASVFFNSALHKEPNMELASGLIVFGGTMIWKRLDVRGILICGIGGLIAIETRSYAGWFLVSAAVLTLLHASLRSLDRPLRAIPAIYAIAIIVFLATPTFLSASSTKSLRSLQLSQTANATGTGGAQNTDNLAFEHVDFSSRAKVLINLPKRIRDLLVKPYPWQLTDTSQRFGAAGSLVAYAVLLLLLWSTWLSRGQILPRAGPLLYPLLFLLVAYSLAVGNAGTGFRYRTHLVTLGIAAVAILREQALMRRAGRTMRMETPETDAQHVGGPIPSTG